jgi:hypothetical protein
VKVDCLERCVQRADVQPGGGLWNGMVGVIVNALGLGRRWAAARAHLDQTCKIEI